MDRRRAATALCVAFLAACSRGSPSEPDEWAGIRAAPPTVVVGGATLGLEAHLWRDFQPISPPDGKPLAAVVRVKTVDGAPLPAKIEADTVWVFNGALVWIPPFEVVAGGAWVELVARDGPKWGPGILVDVVVRLRDAAGASYLVQARGQPITRTD